MKLIAATLSRHVASPKAYNNDSSRPGRYIMPRKRQGTIIPVMNINRYYPVLIQLKLPHFERKRITPFDVNHKNRASHNSATLGFAQNSSAKIQRFLKISKLYTRKFVVMEDKPPNDPFSPVYFSRVICVKKRPVGILTFHHISFSRQCTSIRKRFQSHH